MPDIVLCSKHQKGAHIAPELEPLGYSLVENSEFNTDSLGTFSGEIERKLTPKEAALVKAIKACELSGNRYGLGSEGSFGGGPMPGFMNWNEEILCFYDNEQGVAVYALANGPCKINNLKAQAPRDLAAQLKNFPQQAWLWHTPEKIHKRLFAEQLLTMADSNELSFPITLQPDLRAMHCPERQIMIAKAAQDLATRLQSHCPECQALDFVVKEAQKGRLCSWCHLPTEQIKATIKVCERCQHEEIAERFDEPADPGTCQFCNP
ncbi:DUF6671 family protein [Planctobacterium marinum]|uniref:DUF6671 domain-containing protein n=1 Tax=Planctobacterium marinum TaxID=1631968 RepID=A0AA48HS12_9ALTE|nr:hypothetical protein MACH26_03040 [Planctobacterium marinum]